MPDQAQPQAKPEKPDLNDPNVRLPRDEAMAAMLARRRETAAADMDPADRKAFLEAPPAGETPPAGEVPEGGKPAGEVDPDVNQDDLEAEAARKRLEAEGGKAADQLERQRAEETILSDEDLGKYKVRVKINGKEELLPLTDVRARAQKVGAADDYLLQAKTLLSEVKDTIKAAPVAPAPAAAPEPAAAVDGPDPIDEFVDAMFAGDDAKAKAALKKARTGQPAATPEEAIALQVERRIVLRSALRKFASDNPDIMADPMARRVADTYLLEETGGKPIEQIEPERVEEVLSAAATKTREFRNMKAPAPATRATTRDEKRAMKATIDELPTAATRSASALPAPRTASNVIEEMARARGQRLSSA